MPIWLRKFTFSKIKEFYEAESKQVKDLSTSPKSIPKGPSIRRPTYTAKISK